MADGNILSDFGIDLLEEEIDDVIFQTNEFLTDATFTGSQGPFWWILQMCMALAALFAIVMAAGMAYKMMVKHEPLDVMKLFRPLAVSLILCWWYPPADTGMANSGSNWCFLDFLSYIPNCVGSYTHDLYEAEASQISDKFEKVQELIYSCLARRVPPPKRQKPMSPTRVRPIPTLSRQRWNKLAWTRLRTWRRMQRSCGSRR